ncbi:MAG TPA: helix-turn-helix domain-containing protein [Polyangiales bacterium]
MPALVQTLLTPAQAARSLGLSESTVRRLCDDGQLASVRTDGGHRRIRPSDVAAYVRSRAVPASASHARGAAGRGGRCANEKELLKRTSEALLAGDALLLRRLLGELSLAGESAAFIADRLLAPALAELGQRWCDGALSVYREHRASEQVLAAVSEARARFSPQPRARRALCAAPESDPNSLPAAMASWVLAEAGYASVLLGADVPFQALCEAVVELGPRLLVLSISHVEDLKRFTRGCRALFAETQKAGCVLAIGGRALNPELKQALSADFIGNSLAELDEYARSLRPRRR